MTKRCPVCRETKSAAQFYRDRSKNDGCSSQCKLCVAKYRQREDVKARLREYNHAYLQSDRGKARKLAHKKSPKGIATARAYNNSERGKDSRLRYNQKETAQALRRAYYLRTSHKRIQYQREYKAGFTQLFWEAAWKIQNGACAICLKKLESTGRGTNCAAADHCHATNTPRGILCQRCNLGLGIFSDNPHLLRAAIVYIEDPPLSLLV